MSQSSDSNNPNKVGEDNSKLYSFSPALPLNSKVSLAKNPDNESVIPQIDDSGTIQQPKLTKVTEVSPNFISNKLNLDLDKVGESPKLKSQQLTHIQNLSTISEASPSQEQISNEVEQALAKETQYINNSSPNSEKSGEFIMVSPKQEERQLDSSLGQSTSQISVGSLRRAGRLNSFDGEPTSITSKSPHLSANQIEHGPKTEASIVGVTKRLSKQSPILPQSFSGSPTLATIQNPNFEINSNLEEENEEIKETSLGESLKISEISPDLPSSDAPKTEIISNTTVEAHLTNLFETLPESFEGETTRVKTQEPVDRKRSVNSLHSYDGECTKIALHGPDAPISEDLETYFNQHQHTHLEGEEHHLPKYQSQVTGFTNYGPDHKNSVNSLNSCDDESTKVKAKMSPYSTPESIDAQPVPRQEEETKVEEHKLTNQPSSLPMSFSGTPTYIRVQNPEMSLKNDGSSINEDSDSTKKKETEDLPIISHSLDIEEPTSTNDMTSPNTSIQPKAATRDLPKLDDLETSSAVPTLTQNRDEAGEKFYDVEEIPSSYHLKTTSAISNNNLSPSKKDLKVQFSTEEGISDEEEEDDDDDDDDVNYYKILTLPSFPKKIPTSELVTEKYKKQIILAQFDKYEYKTQPKKPSNLNEEDEIEQEIEMRLKAITESYLVLIDNQEQLRYFSHRQHAPNEEFEFDYDNLIPRDYDLIFCKQFHEELIKVLFPPRFFFIPITIVLGYILGFYYYGFIGLIIGGYLLSYLGDYLDTRPNCSTITKWNGLNDNQRKACIHGLSRKFL